ncbi:aspartate carbamoyltransferase [Marine Group I thaumarchaeote]|jgi:aspartate carbamoyltransferase catalytic subunit|uniref:Aspartate carbamoyltransferase n=1 Tax=Marine Group I thaumarchaeote TaxID=2511932 RepID=A0A7K4NHE0_9ARCH|nr:MAG: aspartate carbamoyltransferase [Nitrosopumilus sp. YT1]NMI82280.1 aspartate carbamoyltransferase [Candidatus Nitrosopumilus sp. MTA1]NWJ19996.1 aspartate carbamoyltransferase [Marine Group I thaumarchaeote]NWJ27907.1 aspartate carbamoyltransferase [Marine Group I thaumarchaeote]NWJ30063.1 aspartate carbamoyltransferase [Marine Group I thaumarchaeote]
MNEFYQKDIISIKDFDKEKLEKIFVSTDKIIKLNPAERREICKGKTLAYLFYEPSTRTRLSFDSAIASVGGNSLGISDITSSSAQKGESLADTVRIMSIYSDVLVLRHTLDGSSRFAAEISEKPVINAGSGTEEHPTQAIQDLYTIKKEKKKIDGLKIGIVGDLKYGRTVYSLLHGLGNYDVDVRLISPESLRVRSDSIYEIKKKLDFTESTNIDEHIDEFDVLYVTRIQKERFPDEEEYLKVKGSYVVGLDLLKQMKDDSIILHPLPRIDEISTDVDNTKHAKYFEQAEYGKHVRAALLGLILNEHGF